MNIVCVAACTAGIAHTYIAREKLIKGAHALGHTIHVKPRAPSALKRR
jgi:PTS system IIB component